MSDRRKKYEETLKRRKLDAIMDKFSNFFENLSDSQDEEFLV